MLSENWVSPDGDMQDERLTDSGKGPSQSTTNTMEGGSDLWPEVYMLILNNSWVDRHGCYATVL